MCGYAPTHIEDFCVVAKSDPFYNQLYDKFFNDYTSVFKIRCSCGSSKFFVYKDNHPSIYLKCKCCSREIIAYELDFYPAATKLEDFKPRTLVCINGIDNFNVYAIYQYPEDAGLDKDDISWCVIYIKNDENVVKILDDETA